MRKVADVVVSVGKDNSKGKKVYTKVGVLFRSEQGHESIRLHVLPMPRMEPGSEFPVVWLKIMRPDVELRAPREKPQPTRNSSARQPPLEREDRPDDAAF